MYKSSFHDKNNAQRTEFVADYINIYIWITILFILLHNEAKCSTEYQCKPHATRSLLIDNHYMLQLNSSLEQTQTGLKNNGMVETKLHKFIRI